MGITNSDATGNDSLGILLTTNTGTGTITGPGFTNLKPSMSTNVTISVTKGGAGVTSGQGVFAMNDTGYNGLDAATNLGSQTITYTSTGYNYASGAVAATNIDLGRIHAGGTFGTTNLSLSNTGLNSAYTETLGATIGSVTGGASGTGNLTGLAAGSADTSLSVTLTNNTAGSKSGTLVVNLTSEAINNSGLGNTSLGSKTVNVTGFVYTGQGVWNTNGGSWSSFGNWQQAGGVAGIDGSLSANDTATFGSGGSGSVTLDGATPSVQGVTFSNSASSYTIAQGTGGSLTLQAGNTNASINVQAGSHAITAPITFASDVTVTTVSNSALTLGSINGVGGLTVRGSGTTTLTASNSFGGNTIVSSGTLLLNASASSMSSYTTVSGGSLINNGSIAGTTALQSGGTLAGNRGSFSNLRISGGTLIWNINSMTGVAGSGWDQLSATNLDVSALNSGNQLTIKVVGDTKSMDAAISLYSFNFLSVLGTLSSIDTNGFRFDTTGLVTTNPLYATNGTWAVGQDLVNGGLAITYAVPEPSTYALIALSAIALMIVARRKRTSV